MAQILTSSERIKMSLFTRRHYEVIADRLGKEIAVFNVPPIMAIDITMLFINFFAQDSGKFSESIFEKAVLKSAESHGWTKDQKEEVI
jgi:hypothetical protein